MERQVTMNERLLEHISQYSGLYISDLLLPDNSEKILEVMQTIDPNDFTVEEWSASLSYLLRRHLRFATTSAAKDFYIKSLLNNLTAN